MRVGHAVPVLLAVVSVGRLAAKEPGREPVEEGLSVRIGVRGERPVEHRYPTTTATPSLAASSRTSASAAALSAPGFSSVKSAGGSSAASAAALSLGEMLLERHAHARSSAAVELGADVRAVIFEMLAAASPLNRTYPTAGLLSEPSIRKVSGL